MHLEALSEVSVLAPEDQARSSWTGWISSLDGCGTWQRNRYGDVVIV